MMVNIQMAKVNICAFTTYMLTWSYVAYVSGCDSMPQNFEPLQISLLDMFVVNVNEDEHLRGMHGRQEQK